MAQFALSYLMCGCPQGTVFCQHIVDQECSEFFSGGRLSNIGCRSVLEHTTKEKLAPACNSGTTRNNKGAKMLTVKDHSSAFHVSACWCSQETEMPRINLKMCCEKAQNDPLYLLKWLTTLLEWLHIIWQVIIRLGDKNMSSFFLFFRPVV